MTVKVSKPAINVREELADLKKPTGIAGQAMLAAETPQEQFQLIGAGRRNLIINGDFQVSQRGDYSSNTNASQNAYYIDRWKHLVQVVTAQIRRDNGVIVDGKRMTTFRMEATSSVTGRFGIRQCVEARGTRCPIEDGPATLSVWMRSTNPNACLLVYQYSGGGYIGHTPYTGGGEWQKLSLTVEAPNSSVSQNAISLELNFGVHTANNGNVSITSGDYIEIAQPQLEAGKVATPFEHRSYGEELLLCSRYYTSSFRTMSPQDGALGAENRYYSPCWKHSGSSRLVGSVNNYPVPMRTTPTITFYRDTGVSSTNGRWGYYNATAWQTAPLAQSVQMNSHLGFTPMVANSESSLTKNFLTLGGWAADAEL